MKNHQVIEIPVLKKHIKKGKQKSRSSCAIAMALKDHFVDASWVQVWGGANILVDNKNIKVLDLDAFVVQNFINQFDRNKSKCQPFSFRLMITKKPTKL